VIVAANCCRAARPCRPGTDANRLRRRSVVNQKA
jgi:hypothetical protein